MRTKSIATAVGVLLLLVATVAPDASRSVSAAPADSTRRTDSHVEWPGWRGARQSGAVSDPAFTIGARDGLRMVWKRELGTGYSSVSVVRGHAVTLFGDGQYDYVVSLDPRTGREQWRYRLGPTFKAPVQSNDGPLSTPAIGHGLVFAIAPRGRVVALRLESGALVWSRDLVVELGAEVPYFGFSTSPLLAGRVVCIQAGGSNGSIVAFDVQTGAVAWRAGSDTVTYQTPVLATLAGEEQIVFAGDARLHGVRPSTGEVLWMREHGVRADAEAVKQIVLGPGDLNPISPVIVGDDGVLLINYYGASSVLFRVTRESGQYTLSEAWRNTNIRRTYALPVATGEYLFGFTNRFPICLSSQTGEIVWRSRPPGDGWVIGVDDYLVFLTKDEGSLHVARATAQRYEELTALPMLDNVAWTPPSYALGMVFARNFKTIAAAALDRGGARPETTASHGGGVSSTFERFVRSVREAPVAERQALVTEYLRSQPQFPIIEGDRTVHVVFRGNAQDVAVEGDMLETGEQAPMTRIDGTDVHYASFTLDANARVSYRLSVDYRSSVRPDPLNPRKVALPGGEHSEIVMPRWTPPPYAGGPPRALGTIERFELPSVALKKTRAIDVYLPPGYAQATDRYAVLYVADGKQAQALGKLVDTLDVLTSDGRIRPVIAVLVDPSPLDELTGTQRDRYAEMLARELVARIDASYRTLAEPAHRAVMGAGAAGYAAIYAAFRHPGTFGLVGGQSTHLLGPIGGDDLVALVKTSPHRDVRFYLGWGKYDMRGRGVQRRPGLVDWRKDNREFVRLLADRHYEVKGVEFHEGTGWAGWRNYVHHVLEFLLPRDDRRGS